MTAGNYTSSRAQQVNFIDGAKETRKQSRAAGNWQAGGKRSCSLEARAAVTCTTKLQRTPFISHVSDVTLNWDRFRIYGLYNSSTNESMSEKA